jgi:cyclopropane fatty-acyl-phospholipid synthase-like methyltransferase
MSDCQSWDWQSNQYDAVVAIFIQFAPPEMRKALFANVMNCLRPGGILILQGYTPEQLNFKTGGPSQVEYLYTESLIRDLLSPMDILLLRDYQAELNEGLGHLGQSSLLGVVARKV